MIQRRKTGKTRRKPVDTSGWPKHEYLKPKDLEGFLEKVQKAFGWNVPPRTHQAGAIEAQLCGKSVLVHAGTGSGKTAIAAGPHVHEKSKGKVTIMVSPLIALQEEQVKTFDDEFQLSAVAVNSAHGGCSPELMTKICSGVYQIVVISPEMLLSKRFIKNVIKNREFSHRVLSVVVDEAHVVSHWGSGFRKHYGRLNVLRALLPKGTPIVAMSATLPPRVRRDVVQKLQLGTDYITINLGNDQKNVSIVVRGIHNPMNTYTDLDFLIPPHITETSQIPKSFIYADSISTGPEIERHLYELLPEELRAAGVIRPYSAAFTKEYRAELMRLFKLGAVRILICTDAAGMGCNIPDVDIVVQWKLPSNVSSFIQRGGRAARADGRTGLAVLLVEKSTFEADLSKLGAHRQQAASAKKKSKKTTGVRQPGEYPKATKEYAILHGGDRGRHSGTEDSTQLAAEDVLVDYEAPDEGLYSLVQTTRCRRRVLAKIFGNEDPEPTVPCCDLCNPELLNRTRPGPPRVVERATPVRRGELDKGAKIALWKWRTSIITQDFADSLVGTSGILKDETIDILASVGPITSKQQLERVLGGRWLWLPTYGESLWTHMQTITFLPFRPKPKQPSKKRVAQDELSELENASSALPDGGRKRQRKQAPPTSNTSAQCPPSNQVTPQNASSSASTSRLDLSSRVAPAAPAPTHPYPYPYPYPYQHAPQYPPYQPQSWPPSLYYPQQPPHTPFATSGSPSTMPSLTPFMAIHHAQGQQHVLAPMVPFNHTPYMHHYHSTPSTPRSTQGLTPYAITQPINTSIYSTPTPISRSQNPYQHLLTPDCSSRPPESSPT